MTEHDPSVLQALVGPPERFLRSCWPGRPFVHHGALDRLRGLSELPALSDARALAGAYGEDVTVWFGGALADGPLASLHGRRFSPRDALGLHEAGATLFFERVDPWVPMLRPLCRTLERELGLRRGSIYCSGFASPAGGTSPAHFDPDLNFSVQLRGRKRWRLAPNHFIVDPTQGYSVTHEPEEVPAELRRGLERPLPRAMPSDVEEIELSPGSVLFVPRGYWHETVTAEDGLALVFVVAVETWADAVSRRLRAALTEEARWRAMVPADAEGLPDALREALESTLRRAVDAWRSGDDADPRYRRRPGSSAELVEDREGSMLRVPEGASEVQLRLDGPLVPLVQHLLGCERGVERSNLDPFAVGLGEATVDSVLAELVEVGVLEAVR